MVASALVTGAAAAAIWIVVRDDPSERGYRSYFAGAHATPRGASIAESLREVFRYRNVWLIVALPGGFSSIVLTFAGLWGVPFLVTQHGFTTRAAAMTASAMLIAWALGGLFFAQVSQRVGARKPVLAAGLAATLAAWAAALAMRSPAAWVLIALLVATAFLAGAFILTFAFAKESVPARLGGTVSGIANMGVMLGGMLMQPLVGWLLDRSWDGALADGVRVYGFEAFQRAFAPTFAWGCAALVLIAAARETHCKQMR
jgi:MFS family permease